IPEISCHNPSPPRLFSQAEDVIRDRTVTGVQTCALPIYDIYVDRHFLARKLADAKFVVTISEYNRRLLDRDRNGAATPIHVVRCGIEPARYRFSPRRSPDPGRVSALCVASLQEYKGHRVLLDALA